MHERRRGNLCLLEVSYVGVHGDPRLHRPGQASTSKATCDDRADSADVRTIAALLNVQYRQLPGGEFNHSTVITLLSPLGVVETSSSKLGTPDPALVAKLGD